MEKFNLMESRVLVEKWQEGDDSLTEYVSQLGYFYDFIYILWWCKIFIYCFMDQMTKIPLEERMKILDKIKVVHSESDSPHNHPEGVITKGRKGRPKSIPWLPKC